MYNVYDSIEVLLEKAIGLFQKRFNQQPTVAVCSPGRVNLIGDHVDYNGGFVLPMALPMVTVAVGKLNNLNVCRIETDPASKATDDPKYVEFNVPSASNMIEPGNPKWANYVKGVVAGFHGDVGGFDCVFVSSVPVGAGLSSSAAIEVATYTLLEHLNDNILIIEKDKALACQKAEHEFAGVPCGVMDQFICSMAKEGCALLIDCKSLEANALPLEDPNIVFLIIDSKVKHNLSGSEYPQRRSQCEKVARFLNKQFLRDVSREELIASKELLGEQEYNRALHVINETEYTRAFVKHLQSGDYKEAGQAMFNSHSSLRDLYNVSCQELDDLVGIAGNTAGVFGARMTGGGFGGCVVCLMKNDDVESTIESIQSQSRVSGIYPNFYVCAPSPGARRLDLQQI